MLQHSTGGHGEKNENLSEKSQRIKKVLFYVSSLTDQPTRFESARTASQTFLDFFALVSTNSNRGQKLLFVIFSEALIICFATSLFSLRYNMRNQTYTCILFHFISTTDKIISWELLLHKYMEGLLMFIYLQLRIYV